MIIKYSKNRQVGQLNRLKESFLKNVLEVKSKLDQSDRMKIAIELKVGLLTINRYLSGDIKEIRRVELVEKILDEARVIINSKEATVTM